MERRNGQTYLKIGKITPIFKKGNPTKSKNCRSVTLLNTTYRILTATIRNRLTKYTEKNLQEYQQGFRKRRSTIDAMHTLTQILEKCYEYDIEQAFNSLNRDRLMKEMKTIERSDGQE